MRDLHVEDNYRPTPTPSEPGKTPWRMLFVRIKNELDPKEMDRRLLERRPKFLEVPELAQKIYGRDLATGDVCGIYFFESEAALAKFKDSQLAKTIPSAYEASDVRREVYEVLYPLRPERGPFAHDCKASTVPSTILFVRIKNELDPKEMDRRLLERRPKFLEVPELAQKIYGRDPAAGDVCGIYFFESEAALARFKDSQLAKTIPSVYEATDVRREVYEVLYALRPERGPFTANATRQMP